MNEKRVIPQSLRLLPGLSAFFGRRVYVDDLTPYKLSSPPACDSVSVASPAAADGRGGCTQNNRLDVDAMRAQLASHVDASDDLFGACGCYVCSNLRITLAKITGGRAAVLA